MHLTIFHNFQKAYGLLCFGSCSPALFSGTKTWKHRRIKSTFPARSLSETEWVAVVSSAVLQWKSWTSVCEASDWHLTNVTVRLLFALRCTSEKPSRGILSLSGIALWTTCSSGAMSSSVVMNNAAGLVTLLWERCVPVMCVCFEFSVCVYAATHLPRRRGLELSPILLLCISLELINSLGLYDWGDCLGALNPIQLIKN